MSSPQLSSSHPGKAPSCPCCCSGGSLQLPPFSPKQRVHRGVKFGICSQFPLLLPWDWLTHDPGSILLCCHFRGLALEHRSLSGCRHARVPALQPAIRDKLTQRPSPYSSALRVHSAGNRRQRNWELVSSLHLRTGLGERQNTRHALHPKDAQALSQPCQALINKCYLLSQ